MKKIFLFLGFVAISTAALLVFNDVSTLNSYAEKIGNVVGYTSGYSQKTVNALQDSVNSTSSALDDLRENKAKTIINEQRKKIEEMRKELEQSMNNSEQKAKSEEKI